jgi:hypothetical protein
MAGTQFSTVAEQIVNARSADMAEVIVIGALNEVHLKQQDASHFIRALQTELTICYRAQSNAQAIANIQRAQEVLRQSQGQKNG